MDHRLRDGGRVPAHRVAKIRLVHEVRVGHVRQVPSARVVRAFETVHDEDIRAAAPIEIEHEVASDEPGAAGDDNG
jgi:hypothetical protein